MTKPPDPRDSGTWHEWEKAHRAGLPAMKNEAELAAFPTRKYHDEERDKAIAAPDDGWNRPLAMHTYRDIIDLGGGAGQHFVAEAVQAGQPEAPRRRVVMDVDADAIRYGMLLAPWVQFVLQGGESIPFPDETFDLAMSRVALVYCNIPKTLREIHRTLKPGGRIWLTLHTRKHSENSNVSYSRPRKFGVWLNSWLLKTFHFTVPIRGRHETWQVPEAFVALLHKHGFSAKFDLDKDPKGNEVLRVTGVKR